MILAPIFTWYWIDTKIPQYGSILLAEHWGDVGSCKRSTWLARHAVVVVTYVTGGVGGVGWGGKRRFVHPAVREMPSSPSCGKRTAKKKRLQSESA